MKLYRVSDRYSMQTEKVVDYIVQWLRDYLKSSHAKGFTIGISGGIDSAVVSTLCARTGEPVLAIEMPIRQSSGEMQRSRAHINWLKEHFPNVTGAEVNLTEIFDQCEKTFSNSEINENNSYTEIAMANTRSRLRMVCSEMVVIGDCSCIRCSHSGHAVLFRIYSGSSCCWYW